MKTILWFAFVYTLFSVTFAQATPSCDLSVSNRETIALNFKGVSEETGDQIFGINQAYQLALENCQTSIGTSCQADVSTGECTHFKTIYGRVVIANRWICTVVAQGNLNVERSYEDICEDACSKIQACQKVYNDTGTATPDDFSHLAQMREFYSCSKVLQ